MIVLSAALAATPLDCTGLDTATCDAVNQMQVDINARVSGEPIDEASTTARLRPSALYADLDALRLQLEGEGCGFPILRYAGGTYDRSTAGGVWHESSGGDGGPMDATFDRSTRLGEGTWTGASSAGWNAFTWRSDGLVVGVENALVLAGRWVRLSGSRGVFVSVRAACSAAPLDVATTLYGRTLPPLPIPDPTFGSTNPDPVDIPDGQYFGDLADMACVEIPVSGQGNLNPDRVWIELQHDWIGDVTAMLENPSGSRIFLFNRPGFTTGGFGNYGTLYTHPELTFGDDLVFVDAETMGADPNQLEICV
ncbi:MAG: hypothetical protein KC656_32060, partial [Myxococcales bacterium]|nr:hypothetical protein [Myxococcales bacterium]